MDIFWAAPPVIRTICAATVVTSALVYGGLLRYRYIVFVAPWVYKKFPPEIWRLATSFWLTGPQLGMVFDPFLLWTYGSNLERDSPRFSRKGDFFVYVAFVQLTILILDGFFLSGVSFLPSLMLAFAYTFAQENPMSNVSFFIFTIPAKFLPFAMLLMTFVMGGPEGAKHQITGLLAAHLYDFLTRIWPTFGGGSNLIQTPQFVQQWFGEGQGPRTGTVRSHGTAFSARSQPVGQPSAGTAGRGNAFTSGFSNWSSRGTGRRLGGE